MRQTTHQEYRYHKNPTGPQAGGLFKDYCKGQTTRTDDIGAFARQIAKDANWPRKVQQFRTLVRYVDRVYGEASIPLLVTLWQESGVQDSPVDWQIVAARRELNKPYHRAFTAHLRTLMAVRLTQDD